MRAPSVSTRSYVGTKLVLDFRIKKIIRASGLQTRSVFNRVQVRVLRILFFEFGEFKFEFAARDFCRSQWHEQINDMQLFYW